MSDLCTYELEDIIWDEICQSDDHIVPQPGDEQGNDNSFQGNSRKKPRHEVIGVSSNAGDGYAAKYASDGKEERPLPTIFPASCDSDPIKEATSLASDNSRMSSHCFKSSNMDSIGSELHAEHPTTGDKCGAVDDNSYPCPLDHISHTDNLSFLDNDCEDEESRDLLFYGWPDIGNYEDVDRMFRSCDSTFGLPGVGNEDELGWFSSTHAIEGSEDVLKSEFKFSFESSPSKNIEEQCDPSKLNNASSSINGSDMESAHGSYKGSSRTSEDDEPPAVGHLSYANASDTNSESTNECMPKEQINLKKEQAKPQYHSEEKRKGRYLENGVPYHHSTNLRFKDSKLPSGNSTQQVFLSQQMQNIGPDSFSYLQTHTPYIHSGHNRTSDQISVSPALPGIESKHNGLTSLPTKECSYTSNKMQSMESSHGQSFEPSAISMDERERLKLRQGFQPSVSSNRRHDTAVQAASKPVPVLKRVNQSKKEVENHSEVEAVSLGVPAELHSSSIQESSCTSAGLDEISFEATSFRQLQSVMEQLDIRTKLCIRDSLYRLARSAERRHLNANLHYGSRDDGETSEAFLDEGTTTCSGLMDIETDTNPIDRSIAHLLFHRPSDSSVLPAHDASSLKSHTMIHGSFTSPPVMTEKLVSQEETTSEEDKKRLPSIDDKQ